MCNANCIIFGVKNLFGDIRGKRILEVGSEDINGSLRSIVEALGPKEYIGVDIKKGRGVDRICNVENVIKEFGKNSFDVVISTELLEHVKDWRSAISNIKGVCKPNGIILITTRSYGFGYHAFPYDFWRYEANDMKHIFSDCKIIALENDTSAPGIFLKAKKPKMFVESDLTDHKLYSIAANKKIKELNIGDLRSLRLTRIRFKLRLRKLLKGVFNFFFQ